MVERETAVSLRPVFALLVGLSNTGNKIKIMFPK